MNFELPFNCVDFDIIYTNIATILKNEYPQQVNETQNEWYKRLLYELLSYVQTQFEPINTTEIIDAKNKNNQKKNDAPAVTIPSLFTDNITRAIEIIYQDPNFAIYLLAWFMPILVEPTNTFYTDVVIDNSDTVASNVIIKNVGLWFETGIYKITLTVNGKELNTLSFYDYLDFQSDAFGHSFLKAIHLFRFGSSECNYENIRLIDSIDYDNSHPQIWSFKLARFLWDIKNIICSLYVSDLTFTTNLSSTIVNLKKPKKTDVGVRKRFNEQKYLTAASVGAEEMSAQIIRTLIIATFRTFYDYDASTISSELFGYLFLNKPLVY